MESDGGLRYYGPSLSEYGQLLTTARRLLERGGTLEWTRRRQKALSAVSGWLQTRIRGEGQVALAPGIPEADERSQMATYFHNNAWIARGLQDWASVLDLLDPDAAPPVRRDAARIREILLSTLEETWPQDPRDWWLRPVAERLEGPYWQAPEGTVTANRLGSYTNYRYWPELLSSGVLPRRLAERIVQARLESGGEWCGVTRFETHLDDWPLMDYLDGLRALGRQEEYRLSLWGHVYYHQAEGHLTAYEQVSLPPGRMVANYCLPCQLVTARAAGYLWRDGRPLI